MGLFNNWPAIRGIVQLVIIQLFCWLACSVSFCFAQLDISEGVTGSVNFPSALAITCVGNLAVFVTTLIRGRLDLEIGARDALGILLGRKLTVINDQIDRYALTTCAYSIIRERGGVVMLSNGRPNSSVREFMKFNAPIVESVLLQFFLLKDAGHLGDSVRNAPECHCGVCKCIVFWASRGMRVMLARRMPGTLKSLSDSLCLLPCLTCLTNGCHGCDGGMLHTEEKYDKMLERIFLTEGKSVGQSPAEPHVVCRILHDNDVDNSIRTGESFCICIPLNDSESDKWTEVLIRSFRSKDAEGRGVRVNAWEALEGYLAGRRGRQEGRVEYSIASFIVPRLTEVLINIVLTVLFKVDGFSSSLVARRMVRNYIVDSKGSGFAANAFLTKAFVKCDADSTCQLLTFRGNLLSIRTIAIAVGCVNMVCSIVWAVLIAFDGGADAFLPPSILAAIVIDLTTKLMLLSPRICDRRAAYWKSDRDVIYGLLYFTEMMCSGIVAATLGTKWVYGALQILVFLKWAVGCIFLDISEENFFGRTPSTWDSLPYSSVFLINGLLAMR